MRGKNRQKCFHVIGVNGEDGCECNGKILNVCNFKVQRAVK